MPLNIDWQQILLHLFNFVLLFAILYFLLYKPVKKFMDDRTAYYKDIEDKANENFAQSEKTNAEYTEKLEKAEDEIAEEKKQAYVESLKDEIQRLEYMVDAPLDDEFKIRIAREKLGMCFPDEIIFYGEYK